MTSLPLTRQQAWELVKKYNTHEQDLIHYLESEAVMRGLAEHLKENVEYWGMLGLLHDIDWGVTKDKVETHLTKMPEMLKKAGFNKIMAKPVIVRLPIFKRANFNIGIAGKGSEKNLLGFFSWLTKVSDAAPEQINLKPL